MKITAVPALPAAAEQSSIMTGTETIKATPTAAKSPINQSSNNESPASAAVPAVTEPKPADKSDELTSKYAELAKREKILQRKIQAEREALKGREAALAAKEAEYASSYIQKNKIKEMFQKDPALALREFDISGDQITHGLLNQPSPQDLMIQKLQAEISELRGVQDQTKNLFDERDKNARAQALNQIKSDVKQLIDIDPAYDTIKSTGSIDAVVEYLEKQFDETGNLLSIEQAAEHVEQELTEELVKYAQLKKIQDRLQKQIAPAAEVTPAVAAVVNSQTPAPIPTIPSKLAPKTLTHSQTNAATQPLTARERAIAILEGRTL